MKRPTALRPTTYHDDDNLNLSANPSFMAVLDARLTRRGILRGGLGTAAAAVLGGLGLSACGSDDDGESGSGARDPVTRLSFTAVDKNLADAVTVAGGYSAKVLLALGDPLTSATPAYANDGSDTDFDNRVGDHHDGMEYFGLAAIGSTPDATSNARGLLVLNHEALSPNYLHVNGESARPASRGRERQGNPGARRHRRGGDREQRRVRLRTRLGAESPRDAADADPDVRTGTRQRAGAHQVLAVGPRGARHHQQLRQRPHALGHLPGAGKRTGPATSPAAQPTTLRAPPPAIPRASFR